MTKGIEKILQTCEVLHIVSCEFSFLYRNIFLQPFSNFNFIFGWFFEFFIIEIKILQSKKFSIRHYYYKGKLVIKLDIEENLAITVRFFSFNLLLRTCKALSTANEIEKKKVWGKMKEKGLFFHDSISFYCGLGFLLY